MTLFDLTSDAKDRMDSEAAISLAVNSLSTKRLRSYLRHLLVREAGHHDIRRRSRERIMRNYVIAYQYAGGTMVPMSFRRLVQR